MARRTWVQDPDTGKLIPKEEYRRRGPESAYIQGDIEGVVSPIDGTLLDDRAKLRRHNAKHGVTDSRDYSPEYTRKTRERELRRQSSEGRVDRIETIRRIMERNQ